MKRFAWMLTIVSSVYLAACNNSSEKEESLLEQSLEEDSVVSPVPVQQDTTLQPKEELVLHASGDTPEEMTFDQDTLEVGEDALVVLSLKNDATGLTMIHNFVLATEGMYKKVAVAGAEAGAPNNYVPKSKHVLVSTPLALPGQTVKHEFKAPPPGTYDFVCTYPDHWKKMHGKLIVK